MAERKPETRKQGRHKAKHKAEAVEVSGGKADKVEAKRGQDRVKVEGRGKVEAR